MTYIVKLVSQWPSQWCDDDYE